MALPLGAEINVFFSTCRKVPLQSRRGCFSPPQSRRGCFSPLQSQTRVCSIF
jgi:hypothetical protein